MDLQVIHDKFRLILNKEQGGWVSPEEIDSYLHTAQMWRFNECLAMYANDQDAKDALSVFSVKHTFAAVTGGLIELPLQGEALPYERLSTVWVQYYDNVAAKTRYKPVKILPEDELASRLDSQLLAPTVSDPVGEEPNPGQIQLYPASAMSGYVYYLTTPQPPIFDYTMVGRVITYDQAGSTQLLWNERNINKILVRALQLAGVNLSDELIINYTAAKEQQDV